MDNSKVNDTAAPPVAKAAAVPTLASKRRAMSKLDWAKGQVLNERRDGSGKLMATGQH